MAKENIFIDPTAKILEPKRKKGWKLLFPTLWIYLSLFHRPVSPKLIVLDPAVSTKIP